ncbi:PIN domain-containing protein [Ekhidna sp.]|uniref:type II toxin-antitoxin system VapC family toxin n=1 Tax=Ekhidna sp. TaxID=2608089 RepID=UPI0032EE3A5F
MGILIDSDVLLDVLTYREPFVSSSRKVLEACENGEQNGFITPLILSNVYYILRKSNPNSEVLRQLRALMTFIGVIAMNKEDVLRALNSKFKDLEDALQNSAAENSLETDIIVTRNTKDYKHSSISVMTPSEFVKTI